MDEYMDAHMTETPSAPVNPQGSKRRLRDTRGVRQRIFENWLTPEGRLGRRLYRRHILSFGLVLLVLFFVAAVFLAGLFQGFYEGRALPDETTALAIVLIALLAFCAPLVLSLYVFFCASLRRWHDVGRDDRSFLWCVVYPVVLIEVSGLAYQKLQGMRQSGGYFILSGDRYAVAVQQMQDADLLIALTICLFLLGWVAFLFVRDGEARDNAFGTRESAERVAPEITERPRKEMPMLSSVFRYRGRLNRKRFILRALYVSVPFVLFLLVFDSVPWQDVAYYLLGFRVDSFEVALPGAFRSVVTLEAAISLVYSLFFLYCMLGLFVHRLHDLGLSGCWIAIPSAGKAVLDGWHMLNAQTMTAEQATYYTASLFLYALYQSLLTAYLVFAKGDGAVNRYGENSLMHIVEGIV